MIYLSLILFFIIIYLTIRLTLLIRAVREASKQMSELETQPEANAKLKALTFNKDIEELFSKINDIYQARQQERILYQRRENQIRREIENISHDLRTPLTSILGYIDLIQNDVQEEQEKEEFLNVIKSRARILQSFIQNFYELSRIEGENYPVLLENVTVQSILADTAVAYYNDFERKQIRVELIMEDKNANIIVDRSHLSRIFNNLIQNALKYASHSFIIRQFSKDKECILQFQNDKGNLTELELNFIFDRFYCGDQTRSNNSTGLGLTISKLLIEKMKGSIQAFLDGENFVIEIRFPSVL